MSMLEKMFKTSLNIRKIIFSLIVKTISKPISRKVVTVLGCFPKNGPNITNNTIIFLITLSNVFDLWGRVGKVALLYI